MSTIINATTTTGVVIQPDNSGSLVLQTNSGTTALTIDTSQRAAFVAGTAALPAITTTGDTNTGIWFPAADTIAFAEGGAESMRIDSSGNVGIGATNPGQKLDISTSGDIQARIGNSVTGAQFTYDIGRVAASGLLQFYGNQSGATGYIFSGINGERMRIDSSGNLLLQKTSATLSGAGTYFEVPSSPSTMPVYIHFCKTHSGARDAIDFNHNGTRVGNILFDNTNTSYNTSSDYRLKENIVPMTGALDTVAALKPVTYKWKQDGSDGQGFIAHELAEIVPDAVTGEKDAVETYTDEEGNEQTRIKPQGIDTSFLVATLTAAIQEQQTIINDLKARIETLEAK